MANPTARALAPSPLLHRGSRRRGALQEMARRLLPVSFFTVGGTGDPAPEAAGQAAAARSLAPTPVILVIDDDKIVCAVTERVLCAFGFRVMTATDPGEGVALFRSHASEIGCTLLDVTMPGPGVEVTLDEIRREQPGARVILVSGHDAAELASRFASGEVSAVLQKPFDPDKLRSLLEDVLNS